MHEQAMRLLRNQQSSEYAPIARVLYSMIEGTEMKERLGYCLIYS